MVTTSSDGLRGTTAPCPRCGGTGFELVYVQIMPDDWDRARDVELASPSMMLPDGRAPEFACQDPACRHLW
ncbi:hypothetical protein LQU92_09565 [Kocuria sp. LUK]|uniref:Uncharacterized protein n=1 Tax=Kocuria flava TaxID=446860 RepID=A0A2N4T1B9_9MICC|nr:MULTISPECIES: hypothetical protein [Kocuria]MCD1145481.1 hypothetical protein [Kocuria sp. LUK]MCJ8504183.1 hypothetical protein [Kocuria flava]PLC12020.1 hypothetical protein AUQ48_06985 [Kocuria flava]